MTELPLTVLARDGVLARAYLAALAAGGFRPASVVVVADASPHLPRVIAERLLGRLRLRGAAVAQARWPRHLQTLHAPLVDAMTTRLRELSEHAPAIVSAVVAAPDYGRLVPRVAVAWARGLGDPAVGRALLQAGQPAVLYAGSALVPPSLIDVLANRGVRLLHVHPGLLPHVRGADGLLWSTLVRGQPAATLFALDAGLDSGPVLASCEFPALTFSVAENRPSDDLLYRAIFSFYDPILRATTLIRALRADTQVLTAGGRTQDGRAGTTFHFMHRELRRVALARIFPSSR